MRFTEFGHVYNKQSHTIILARVLIRQNIHIGCVLANDVNGLQHVDVFLSADENINIE